MIVSEWKENNNKIEATSEDEFYAAIHSLTRKTYTMRCHAQHSNRCTMKTLREINTLWRCTSIASSNDGRNFWIEQIKWIHDSGRRQYKSLKFTFFTMWKNPSRYNHNSFLFSRFVCLFFSQRMESILFVCVPVSECVSVRPNGGTWRKKSKSEIFEKQQPISASHQWIFSFPLQLINH